MLTHLDYWSGPGRVKSAYLAASSFYTAEICSSSFTFLAYLNKTVGFNTLLLNLLKKGQKPLKTVFVNGELDGASAESSSFLSCTSRLQKTLNRVNSNLIPLGEVLVQPVCVLRK